MRAQAYAPASREQQQALFQGYMPGLSMEQLRALLSPNAAPPPTHQQPGAILGNW